LTCRYFPAYYRDVQREQDARTARVFRALADPTRRWLLDRLHADNGQTLRALSAYLAITRQSIAEHLALLEDAGLVATVWRGREKLHYLNPVPLHEIHERWIAKFERSDLEALSGLKNQLEQEARPMDSPKLVYVTYIATTPQRLWDALTDPEVTARYWGHRNVSNWALGDTWEHRRVGDGVVDIVGRIVEVDPPRRLAHTWRLAADADNPGRWSRVTFDIEPNGEVVRLTLTHEDVPAQQVTGTDRGWAKVLSNLKSLLETGRPLPALV
jgi:uncharacterized protein YndB with AHSA1/START domain/DNA-binding transcriptional ArsR family regulator